MAERRKMKHRIDFDEKQGVLFIRIVKDVSPEEFLEVNKLIASMPQEKRKRILIDASDAVIPKWNREMREAIFRGTSATPPNTLTAVTGLSPALRVFSKTIINIAGKHSETKFFKSEEEALSWLKGDAK
ncbi:STAS/SEC14 domain-containing protein [candidate division WOR-3 bacterium]|nr:STAS/SEC14 domain-containing protein [candidate division WOR-3 bacterium]